MRFAATLHFPIPALVATATLINGQVRTCLASASDTVSEQAPANDSDNRTDDKEAEAQEKEQNGNAEPGTAGIAPEGISDARTESTWKDSLTPSGISLSLSYSADFFYNAKGGRNTSGADQYRGLLGIDLTLDTEQIGLWPGGTFFLSAFENHGSDITERHLGDLQVLNNADAANDIRFYEYWYEHVFFDEKLRLKLGKIDANNDFAGGLYRDEFVHSSAGFSPTMPLPTWPEPALGVVLRLEPTDWLYVSGGIFDALGTGTRSGFETAFHSPDEVFAIAELGILTSLTIGEQRELPGQYAIGGWYHSGVWPVYFNDLDGRLPPRSETGNAGLYLTFDQFLYREPVQEAESDQGLGVFFQFGWAPSDRNEITQHYGGGFQYYGPIPSRDQDVVGLGVQHVSLGSRIQSLEKRYSETAIEFFYKVQVSECLSIKPDLHYIINPGGAGRDAIVAGVRVEVSF